jgi:hypothetical protein
MASTFFYDQQIRRFLLQFTRMMSNFQVEFGSIDPTTGSLALQTVPVFYGDQSRQAAQILRGQSENSTPSVPAMAFYITGFVYDRTRMQDPTFVGKLNIRERKYDPATGMQTHEQGDTYTVERLMPVPFILTLKLDIWTSNTEQKLQLIEQIGTLFNPSLEIQSTDNYIDWTSLSYVLLTDIQWSSRTVPAGQNDEIDVATMTFELPVWLSPPAKVTKMGVIQRITTNVYDSSGNLDADIYNPDKLLLRRTFTVLGYGVVLINNTLELIKYNETYRDSLTTELQVDHTGRNRWRDLINEYGTLGNLENGISEVRLEMDSGLELIGSVAYHPTDETKLLFSVYPATVPVNTLPAITAIIDPLRNDVANLLYDSEGNYQVPAGTRYLVLEDINSLENTEFSQFWSPNNTRLVAHANDIIEFDGTGWRITFDSQARQSLEYVTNLTSGIQYKWTGDSWFKSYEGVYRESQWRLVI